MFVKPLFFKKKMDDWNSLGAGIVPSFPPPCFTSLKPPKKVYKYMPLLLLMHKWHHATQAMLVVALPAHPFLSVYLCCAS